MMWISENLAEAILVVGLILLAVEIAILGFATFILFFVGIGCLVTGVIMTLGIIPETTQSAILSIGMLTAFTALVAWKPLKNLQKDVDNTPAQSDLIGHTFTLSEDIGPALQAHYNFSGIRWQLLGEQALCAGTIVKVTKVEVGKLTVMSVDQ